MCPECGLAEGSVEWRRLVTTRPRRWRVIISFTTSFIIMYAPYSWLLFIGGGWDEYHWHWIRMWLGLPGLALFHGVGDESLHLVYAHAFSLGVLASATLLGGRGWKWLVPIALALAPLSIWNSIGLYHAFLA